LTLLGTVGIVFALHLTSYVRGPFSQVVVPLYSNDSNEVIQKKMKIASVRATIDPSVVLPFWSADK
jgi:hypothetical protein